MPNEGSTVVAGVERAWKRDRREVQATLIHEMLHSLGLGENPPAPRDISDRVNNRCWQ